jgi:hypothetical protein
MDHYQLPDNLERFGYGFHLSINNEFNRSRKLRFLFVAAAEPIVVMENFLLKGYNAIVEELEQ